MRDYNKGGALIILLVMTVGLTFDVHAVNLSPTDEGQVLIFPYYTTRADRVSRLSVVNNSVVVKAIHVRFIEGKASQEVKALNLYLAPHDVWHVLIYDNGLGAELVTSSQSCTVPLLPGSGTALSNTRYIGDAVGDDSLDRTREGRVELIEMAVVTGVHAEWARPGDRLLRNCGALVDSWNSDIGAWNSDAGTDTEAVAGGGSIAGDMAIFDPLLGAIDYAYDAFAMQNFNISENLHTYGVLDSPSLDDATPVSLVIQDGVGVVSSWGADLNLNGITGGDAVSAILMQASKFYEWSIQDALGFLVTTQLVVAFPTKNLYVPTDGTPSVDPYSTGFGSWGACEGLNLEVFGPEAETPLFPVLDFSPPQIDVVGANFCWDTSLIDFNNRNLLGSMLSENLNLNFLGTPTVGTLRIGYLFNNNFTGVMENPTLSSDEGHTFVGLPTIGMLLQNSVLTMPRTPDIE